MFNLRQYWRTEIWSIFIAILLFTPGNKLPKMGLFHFEHADKIIHFFLFLVLEFFLLYDKKKYPFKNRSTNSFLMVIMAVAYGGFTEIIQSTIINERKGSWVDFIFDCCGIGSAYIAYYIYGRVIIRSYWPKP
jgi:VanZ family protein